MPTVRDVIRRLDDFAPPGLALDDDPAGLAFGDPDAPARRVLFALLIRVHRHLYINGQRSNGC